MPIDFFIYGAGGHSKVVYDAAKKSCEEYSIAFLDGDSERIGYSVIDGVAVVREEHYTYQSASFHVAIGNNLARKEVSERLLSAGNQLITIIHPNSSVSSFAKIEEGCFIAAQTIIGPDVVLSSSVIVNHGAIVDHDCYIGAFSHIAPNVTLGGGVNVGQNCLVGAGAVVLPGVTVGNDVIIAAGAVVISDVADGLTIIGVPGKMKQNE
ncbi:acetyltransferase [uncultured Amphritea sp.]|uniref:acetyltransferase n=1 Tax=uncultured Amphritea sp. TaxID=981605 RepID=UPI002620E3D2|nr:acetyltransferase [uncultured Amphritea sp.]